MKKVLCALTVILLVMGMLLPALAEEAADEAVQEVAETVEEAAEDSSEAALDIADAATKEASDAAEEAEDEAEEAETWADMAFEDLREAKWYVYAIVAALAIVGVAGIVALSRKDSAKRERMSTRAMVEGAMMIAVATVLSMIKIVQMPLGGSVTLFAMLPIVLFSFRHGTRWGLLTAFAHSLIQLILGIKNIGYCATLAAQIACVLLDYVFAYTVLGFASSLSRLVKNRTAGVCVGTALVCAMRFVCHFFSGIFLWGSYKEYYDWAANMPTWLYSLLYNGNYMLLETVITVIGAVILVRGAARLFDRQA